MNTLVISLDCFDANYPAQPLTQEGEHEGHSRVKMAQKCVHKGCGKVFGDPEEECVYHPGPPEFHEGQKGKDQDKRSPVVSLPFFSFLCSVK